MEHKEEVKIPAKPATTEACEADARRYQYLRDNQVWHRHGELIDDDSYALVGCKFPYLANFSTKSMLDYNIDKMLEGSEVCKMPLLEGKQERR